MADELKVGLDVESLYTNVPNTKTSKNASNIIKNKPVSTNKHLPTNN